MIVRYAPRCSLRWNPVQQGKVTRENKNLGKKEQHTMEQRKSHTIFYGWYIVAASFILLFTGIGIAINCQSVLFKPIVQSLGFSRGDFSLFMTLLSLSTMVASPFLGKMLSAFNIRLVMGISTTMATLSFCLLSQCTTLKQFYLCAVFLGAGLAGTHVIPVSMMITNWFTTKRGLALGLAFAATGFGGFVFNPMTNWIIIHYDWQTAFLVLGCLLGITTIPVSVFVVHARPADMGLEPYGHHPGSSGSTDTAHDGLTLPQVVKTASFWLLGAAIFLTGMVCFGIQMHIPAYLTDMGYSPTFAANMVALFMVFMVAGKLVLGAFCDRFGRFRGVLYAYSMVFLATLTIFGAGTIWLVFVFTVLFGLGNTVQTILPPLLTSDIAGRKSYAVIFAVIHAFLTLGIALGVPMAGYIFDSTGSYNLVWSLDLVLCLITILLVLAALALSKAKPEAENKAG